MSIVDKLAKPVGPMPLGAWLVVGAGGLYIASRKAKGGDGEGAEQVSAGDPLPTGGGFPSSGGTQSYDGAPVILQPIFQISTMPPVLTTPTPTITPAPATKPPAAAPRVSGGAAPTLTRKAPSVISYTVRKGDTLSAIALRYLGAASRWTTIYAANKSTIDAKAKAMGKPGGGHWIYPGTVLRIVK